MARLEQNLDRADKLRTIVVVGLFYFGLNRYLGTSFRDADPGDGNTSRRGHRVAPISTGGTPLQETKNNCARHHFAVNGKGAKGKRSLNSAERQRNGTEIGWKRLV